MSMIKAVFYCDIQNEDGEIIQEDFDFDEGIFDSQEKLDKYMYLMGYEIGETCAFWGNDVGILKEIVTDEVDE